MGKRKMKTKELKAVKLTIIEGTGKELVETAQIQRRLALELYVNENSGITKKDIRDLYGAETSKLKEARKSAKMPANGRIWLKGRYQTGWILLCP